METPTLNSLRLQARLTLTDSAQRVAAAMRALSAEINSESDEIMTRWGNAINAAFANAAQMQRQRSPQTPAAMMRVFHTVHLFMRNGLTRMETNTVRFRRHIDRLRRASRRLSNAIRTSVITLRCTRTAQPRATPRRIEELDLEMKDDELCSIEPEPDVKPTRVNDRAFVARMADLLDEKTKRTVTAEERKRAVNVCKRQQSDLSSHMQNWASIATSANAWAARIIVLANESAAIIQTARDADAFLNRANVIY